LMEKQKIFWVVLSVSVFVVVVLIVGIFLLRQRPAGVATGPGAVNPLSDQGTQIYEYQALPQQPGATSATPAQPSGSTESMHFYIGEGGAQPAQGTQGQQTSPAPGQAAPQAGGAPAAQTPSATVPAQKPAPVKPTPQRTTQKVSDYWIQTGSYKSQSKAEELASLLADKGLSGRVFSYATKADTFYRVRIGPYRNKGEAQKFLTIVKEIQGLEASYISMVGSTKTVN
jgi:cell division protein FtsN